MPDARCVSGVGLKYRAPRTRLRKRVVACATRRGSFYFRPESFPQTDMLGDSRISFTGRGGETSWIAGLLRSAATILVPLIVAIHAAGRHGLSCEMAAQQGFHSPNGRQTYDWT